MGRGDQEEIANRLKNEAINKKSPKALVELVHIAAYRDVADDKVKKQVLGEGASRDTAREPFRKRDPQTTNVYQRLHSAPNFMLHAHFCPIPPLRRHLMQSHSLA